MTRDQIQETIVRRLAEMLESGDEGESITGDSDLRKELGLNSLDAVSLVLQIEEDFDVTLDDDEIGTLESVADVVAIIEAKLGARGS